LAGKAHPQKKTPSKGSRKAQTPVAYPQDFEEFWCAYRVAMQEAGGKAISNRNKMPKPDAAAAWAALAERQKAAAKAVLPAYARDAGQYMRYACNYLSGRIFENYAEAETLRADVKATHLAEYLARKRPWDRDMIDAYGEPPGHPNCTMSPEFIERATVISRGMPNGAGGLH